MYTKVCSKCGRVLPVSEFYKSTRGGCKACVQAYHREWWRARRILKRQPLPEGLKRCNGCDEIKALAEFYRDKSTKDGYHSHCKKCSDAAKRTRKELEKANRPGKEVIPEGFKRCAKCKKILPVTEFNRQRSKARPRCRNCEREDRRQNSDKHKASSLDYERRPDVKEKRNTRRQEKRRNDLEYQAKEKTYRQEYKKRGYVIEKNRMHNANYRARPENSEKARQETARWRKENAVQTRLHAQIKYARKSGAEGSHTDEQWQTLLDLCGHKCLKCGAVDKLTRDHIIPLKSGGTNFIDNIQPLCHHCNTTKREVLIIDYRPPQAREWAARELE